MNKDRSSTPNRDESLQVGDLVILLRSSAGNEGAFGTLIRLLGDRPWYADHFWLGGYGPCWLVEWQSPRPAKLGGMYKRSPAPAAWLKRIPPLSELGDVETQEEIHA